MIKLDLWGVEASPYLLKMEAQLPSDALIVQNEHTYHQAVVGGQQEFNEAAFDRGLALYDGEILGSPFRAVVKTFQQRVWRDLCENWQCLSGDQQQALASMLADTHVFTRQSAS